MNFRQSALISTYLIFALGAGATACGLPDTTEFRQSSCKSSTVGGSSSEWMTSLEADVPSGLHCIAWERVGEDVLTVDIINEWRDCEAEFTGNSWIDDGILRISVSATSDTHDYCTCLYDLSYEIEHIDFEADLRVEVMTEGSPVKFNDVHREFTIFQGDLDQGLICHQLTTDDMLNTEITGELFSLCRNNPADTGCQPGLECVAIDDNFPHGTCQQPCDLYQQSGDPCTDLVQSDLGELDLECSERSLTCRLDD